MSRQHPPGDDPPGPEPEYEVTEAAEPDRWWNKDLGNSPGLIAALSLGMAGVAIIAVIVSTPRPPAWPPENVVAVALPPAAEAAPVEVMEPGHVCVISNLRKAGGIGFGGQPGLQFDYKFPRGRRGAGGWPLVAVVSVPGGAT